MHWAAQYIGRPWKLGATGPEAFDCWGLVRHVQATHFGRQLPAMPERLEDRHAMAHEVMRRSTWRRVDGPAQDGDILLMSSSGGPHVATALRLGGVVGCLHAVGSVESPGSVVFTSRIDDLAAIGFARLQVWRSVP